MSEHDLPCGHRAKYAIFGGDNGCLACSAERLARELEQANRRVVAMGEMNDTLAARLADAEQAAKTWENEAERRSRRYEKAAVQLAEAELARDSWKREAEMNADFGDQLHTALAALKKHGVHVAEKWCWCLPYVTDYRHNREGRKADSASGPKCERCGDTGWIQGDPVIGISDEPCGCTEADQPSSAIHRENERE